MRSSEYDEIPHSIFYLSMTHQDDDEPGTAALVQKDLIDDDPEDYEDEGNNDEEDEEVRNLYWIICQELLPEAN